MMIYIYDDDDDEAGELRGGANVLLPKVASMRHHGVSDHQTRGLLMGTKSVQNLANLTLFYIPETNNFVTHLITLGN